MKTIAATFILILVSFSAVVGQTRGAKQIIEEEGQFVFSDSASYYILEKGGAFRSGPLGLSGRMIAGSWKSQTPNVAPGVFVVEGRWSWMNGMSPRNDYRRMTLVIEGVEGFEEKQQLSPVEAPAPFKV